MGNDRTVNEIKDTCTPIISNSDLGFSDSRVFVQAPNGETGVTVNSQPDLPANPCGLIAKSIFTDQFAIKPPGGGADITINTDNIAWKSDVMYKYKPCPDTAYCWLDVTKCKSIVEDTLDY